MKSRPLLITAALSLSAISSSVWAQDVVMPQPVARRFASDARMDPPWPQVQDYLYHEMERQNTFKWSKPISRGNTAVEIGKWLYFFIWNYYCSRFEQYVSNPNFELVDVYIKWYGPVGVGHYYPDMTIVRQESDPHVYVFVGHAPLYVQTAAYFHHDWSRVRTIPAGRIAPMSKLPANGTLMREVNRPEVWYMQGGLRRHIQSVGTLNLYGGWGRVRLVPDNSIGHIWRGAPMP